jgi:hypothetical protein
VVPGIEAASVFVMLAVASSVKPRTVGTDVVPYGYSTE